MEMMNDNKGNLYKVVTVFFVILSVYTAVRVFTDFNRSKGPGMFGGVDNTISISGHGEVQAAPDIANVYFTISKDAKTVKEAQTAVAEIEKKALEVLKTNDVADKDIKTSNASFNPKYESKYMPCNQFGCPGTNAVVVGYTASESITVKVRNIDSAATIIQGLGTVGVTDLSGPNFAIDDEDALNAQARKEAIDEAKAKAKVLAKDLGVKLGDIVSFTEGGNYPMPMYAKAGMMDSAVEVSAPTAQLPKGENTISSDVTITFKIK